MKYYGEILMCSPLPMRKNYETVFEILILKCLANFLKFYIWTSSLQQQQWSYLG